MPKCVVIEWGRFLSCISILIVAGLFYNNKSLPNCIISHSVSWLQKSYLFLEIIDKAVFVFDMNKECYQKCALSKLCPGHMANRYVGRCPCYAWYGDGEGGWALSYCNQMLRQYGLWEQLCAII